MAERPLGITILAILWILGGLFWIMAGLLGGAVLGSIGLGILGAALGIILFIIGIIDLLIGIGCLKGWGWIWTVGVIVVIINIALHLLALVSGGIGAILGLAIGILILWYLFQPNVKAFFGKE
ncbi:MAG TPA: hypothetical protein PK154_03625 [Methanoregulaceae archaeon]|jgi:hypothetical protein|nr:hypothetical protein [Methanoregulaceae archaeon]HOB59245.1 hypothetical protein [Methanoregulaceae archaeon]HOH80604.1 hypothetical protein [Methanoregulaceae archaeon]HPW10186.1 hypothetical protein [Methanoregulaceae archaeon]